MNTLIHFSLHFKGENEMKNNLIKILKQNSNYIGKNSFNCFFELAHLMTRKLKKVNISLILHSK